MPPQPRQRRRAPDGELPEYERPPLAEVVLGIQFDPLVGMTTARLGAAWDLFRRQFPRTEDQAPIATTFERFGSPSDGAQALQWNLDLLGRPALPRVWLINEDGDELVQLQNDRFLHNWRKVDARPDYPRYSKLRAKFEREARSLDRWVAEQGLGSITPNQCEVTYVNHIIADEHWREHSEANKLVRFVAEVMDSMHTGRPEQVRFEASYLIMGGAGAPQGRLHVSLAPGFLKQGLAPMFALTLTARGAPIGDNLEGAFAFLDLGHRSIVLGFDELTTDLMHSVWGRRSR